MFDLGWFELAVVGGLLLIVVGPKDLPKVLRTVGIYMGKARKMAREFQKAMDDYAKDAELDGVKKAVEAPIKAKKAVTSALDPTGTIKKQLTETDSALRKTVEGKKSTDTDADADEKAEPEAPVAATAAGAFAQQPEPDVSEDKPKAAAGSTL